jgi:hypothetical protein
MFYNNQEPRTAFQLGFNPPFFYSISRFSDFGVTPAAIVDEGFPSVNPADAEFPLLITVDENFRSPYYEQWNLAVQKSLPWDMAVEVGYVGTRGLHPPGPPRPQPADAGDRRRPGAPAVSALRQLRLDRELRAVAVQRVPAQAEPPVQPGAVVADLVRVRRRQERPG